MREYELVFIAHPDLDENGLTDLINKKASECLGHTIQGQ